MSLSLADADHFILTRLSTLLVGRLDPIVNPGSASTHAHNIMGGSCINERLNSPSQQQDCDCSSVIIGDDKSNYWSPMLYYQHTNGSFSPILNGNRVYYFLKSKDIKPFPAGLRMISGLAGKKDPTDYKTQGVKISCDHGLQTQYLPNGTSHPGGCSAIQTGIFFPSCGRADGALDSSDHFSHMAWPIKQLGGGSAPFDDQNGAECPDSHPIKYPTIFMEVTYYLSSEQPWHSGNPLILSNGDRSGLTYHADFFDGWKQQTLKDTIAQCGLGKGPGEALGGCAPLAKSMNEAATWDCRYQGKIPKEDVGLYRPIEKLPGCNAVWDTDGPSTKPACSGGSAALIYPTTEFVNLKYREHLPIIFDESPDNMSAYDMKKTYVPSLGDTGASYLQPWGSSGSNKASLKVSTLIDLGGTMNSGGDIDNSSTDNSTTAPANGVVNAADPSTSASVPASSSVATSPAEHTSNYAASSSQSVATSSSADWYGTVNGPSPSPVPSAASSPIKGGVVTSNSASIPAGTAISVTSAAHAVTTVTTHKAPAALSSTKNPKSTGKICKRKKKKSLVPTLEEQPQEVSRDLHAHLKGRSRRSRFNL